MVLLNDDSADFGRREAWPMSHCVLLIGRTSFNYKMDFAETVKLAEPSRISVKQSINFFFAIFNALIVL